MDSLRHLTKSNLPPPPEVEKYLLERLASLDDNLHTVNDELASAQQVVEDLASRHSKLHEKRKAYTAIISPLRRLPDDILSEIICCAVWSSPSLFPDAEDDRNIDSRKPVEHPLATPSATAILNPQASWVQEKQLATLTRICRDWRLVALHTPLLWSTLHLQVYNNDPPLDHFVDHLQRWFDRAADVPLSLTLLFSKGTLATAGSGRASGSTVTGSITPWAGTTQSSSVVGTRFARFLFQNRRRWRELKLNMPSLGGVMSALVGASSVGGTGTTNSHSGIGASSTWKILEILSLSGWIAEDADGDTFERPGLSTVDASNLDNGPRNSMPRLKSLTLHLPYRNINRWNWIPWCQLTKLDLKTADTYGDYVAFLEQCSQLRTCRLHFSPSCGAMFFDLPSLTDSADTTSDSLSQSSEEQHLIFLPHLEELELKCITYVRPLFSKLVLPSLGRLSISQDLRLKLPTPELDVGKTLLDFIDRSSNARSSWDTSDSPDEYTSSASPFPPTQLPLTYLNLHLTQSSPTPDSFPRISTHQYIEMFEKLETLEVLRVTDGETNAEFLDLVQRKGLLPNLKTIAVEVGQEQSVRERFERFVRARTLARTGE
ncbi:hypothetical protein CC1G_08079 [Coprinopsis cinerea okayama7|uniref:Uncharacterized protein n=1 Tax=Coprinopsis cinerea (strain Okayama-7 / 130 / ATCC MYA-4618 / FGSC 9003) TaxID=240176 RepID=A8NVN9_COPC7|nr:hypothetical protein CC1G_08079 [Coprinopsis cinerea okayama7\|eukprot:XP_001836694.2 hypothetical protein CC1G_08079 [Coprinopsis cinerea okayama7\